MSDGHLAHVLDLHSDGIIGGWDSGAAASYETALAQHRRTEVLLCEALARERSLLLQKQELIRKQVVLSKLLGGPQDIAQRVARLTSRERQIMELVLAGYPSKNIAADLGINQRTVENHRAAIMRKTNSKSLSALVRVALAAALHGGGEPVARKARRNDK